MNYIKELLIEAWIFNAYHIELLLKLSNAKYLFIINPKEGDCT
jgi:hypothetical protein